jgi:hypothetical protein
MRESGTLADTTTSFALWPIYTAFDNRTKSAREIWRQMQATRFRRANPNFKINTNVSGSAAAPEVIFTLLDNTEVRAALEYSNIPERKFHSLKILCYIPSSF